jgi:hypothetical protein
MLYLQDKIADFALLAFPTSSLLDYQSLLQFCIDLQGKKEFTLTEFTELGKLRFNFAADQADLYFQTFLLFYHDGNQKLKSENVPTLAFVLYLYNQLFNGPGLPIAAMKIDSEFPSSKEEAHDPLGSLVFPLHSSRASSASMDDMDMEDQISNKAFPGVLAEKRYKLASFWRSSVKRWLTLIYVVLYGSNAEPTKRFDQSLESIQISDLGPIEVFFTPVAPPKDSEDYGSVKARFHHWLNAKEESHQFEALKASGSLKKSVTFEKVDLCNLISDFFKEVHPSSALSIDHLLTFFQWTIMEPPPYFEYLDITTHGICVSSESHSSPIFSEIEHPQG